MQRTQDTRIDLAELKAHIVKKLGVERCRRYFYYLGRFLSQKLTKSEFDKSCCHLLGRENLSLHNKLVRSILRNASLAKPPPPVQKIGLPDKSLVLGKEDGPERNGSLTPNHNRKDPVWSNGLLHKVNGGQVAAPVSRADEAQKERGRLILSTGPVIAPLGISIGGPRRTVPVSSRGGFSSCYGSGGLLGTEMLRKRMEDIAVAQGLGGVSGECSSVLNDMLDLYLKKLIKSSVSLGGVRCANGSPGEKQSLDKLQSQGEIVNRVKPGNSLHVQSDIVQEQHLVSLLDFNVAMELNPHNLGQDWPLLRERILMRSLEEQEGV